MYQSAVSPEGNQKAKSLIDKYLKLQTTIGGESE